MNPAIPSRLSQFRKALSEKPYDTFMVLVGENRENLSGFTGEDTQFDESAGALFITRDKALLATDSRYDLQAKAEAPLYEILQYPRLSPLRETTMAPGMVFTIEPGIYLEGWGGGFVLKTWPLSPKPASIF